MVFNTVKILDIESGAELDETVYDQWVKIEYQDHSLSLFDMDMKVGKDYIGDYVEIKVDAMFTELEAGVNDPPMAKGNRFCGKVESVEEQDGIYEHIIDLEGLRVTLCDQVQYPVGSMIRFKARLDVVELRGSTGGWSNA